MHASHGDNCQRRISVHQLEGLWEFLNTNRVLLQVPRDIQSREHSRRLWEQFAVRLNSHNGFVKDYKGWSKYWAEYKYRLKFKVAVIHRAKLDDRQPTKELTSMEARFVELIGEDNLLKDCSFEETDNVSKSLSNNFFNKPPCKG